MREILTSGSMRGAASPPLLYRLCVPIRCPNPAKCANTVQAISEMEMPTL